MKPVGYYILSAIFLLPALLILGTLFTLIPYIVADTLRTLNRRRKPLPTPEVLPPPAHEEAEEHRRAA